MAMAWRIWRRCAGLRVVIVRQEPFHRGTAVAGAVEDLQQHRVSHLEAGDQGFGLGRATSRLKVPSSQFTNPFGGLALTILRRFAASSPARATARSFSLTCSGAWATTLPAESKPARPALPAIWWNSRAVSSRLVVPSYFDRRREKYRPDGDVYPDAKRVSAAHDFQQPFLAEPLH